MHNRLCKVELTVTKACNATTCGVECYIEAICHGEPMKLGKK